MARPVYWVVDQVKWTFTLLVPSLANY